MESILIFLKRVTTSESASDDLILPHALCVKYGSRIPRGVKLVVRNGYSIWLDYNNVGECFEGIRRFYQFLNVSGGETLVFKHCGGFQFNVLIFDMFGCEIKYPTLPNVQLESDESLWGNHWSFIQHLSWGRKETDRIVVPYDFLDTLGMNIPPKVYLTVSSGHEVVCSFAESNCGLEGLVNVCNMVDAPYLNGFHMLMFTFDGDSRIAVTAFGDSLIETAIAPFEYEIVEASDSDRIAFELMVKDFHMRPYEYVVDIPARYRPLCNSWNKTDYITAYVGMRCWKLQIRHRDDWKRTTINGGWLTFRSDIGLEDGDRCVFLWKNETIRNFDVVVVKANNSEQ